METVSLKIIYHLLSIRETLSVELIVAFPVCSEPSGIKMDHI